MRASPGWSSTPASLAQWAARLIMNAGCYGSETANVLVSVRVMDRQGHVRELTTDDLHFTYRHSALQDAGDLIVLDAVFEGLADEPSEIKSRMRQITERRETTQPIREKTGGSTFKNPPGHSSWKLVDEAGWRGRLYGGGDVQPAAFANFLINTGEADRRRPGRPGRHRPRRRPGQDRDRSWIGRSSGSRRAGISSRGHALVRVPRGRAPRFWRGHAPSACPRRKSKGYG